MTSYILVTGASGFIGFHLIHSLLNDVINIIGIDNMNDYYDVDLKQNRLLKLKKFKNFIFHNTDISNRKSLNEIFQTYKPVKVVNLAAQAGVRYSIENPHAYIDSNLVGFGNILEECRHSNVEGLIYASSSSVYGEQSTVPFDVDAKTDKPISLYASTKISNELMASTYSHLYNLNTTGLRFFTVYGPWGRPDMAYYIFTKKIINNQEINVFNNGEMKRDFTYISDIVSGLRAAINNNYKCEIFNLGNNKSEKLMDLISLIETELGQKAKINFKPMQKGDVTETFANINKSIEMLNFQPKIEIKEGIQRFVSWYKLYSAKNNL